MWNSKTSFSNRFPNSFTPLINILNNISPVHLLNKRRPGHKHNRSSWRLYRHRNVAPAGFQLILFSKLKDLFKKVNTKFPPGSSNLIRSVLPTVCNLFWTIWCQLIPIFESVPHKDENLLWLRRQWLRTGRVPIDELWQAPLIILLILCIFR